MLPSEMKKPSFLSRHKRLLLVVGGFAAAFVLTFTVTAGWILFKASRVFPRTIPEIIPSDALAYVEILDLDERFPDVEAFVAGVRSSPAYRQVSTSHRGWRESGIDRGIDEAFGAVRRIRDDLGVDPLGAFAGSESAVAIWAVQGGGKDGLKRTAFLACTRMSGLTVRVPALFPSAVASSAADGKNVIYDGSGEFPSLRFGRPETAQAGPNPAGSAAPFAIWFTVLKDLLLVSDDPGLLTRTLDVAKSEIPDSLAANPGFTSAFESLEPSAEALGRFYADFDRLDALAGVRKSSRLPVISKFPLNLVANYVNEIQDGVVDVQAARSVAGSFGINGADAVVADFVVHYGGKQVNQGLAAAALAGTETSATSDAGPRSSAVVFRFQRSAREFWDSVRRNSDEQGAARLDAVMTKYGDRIEPLLSTLGADFTVFLQAHPAAAGGAVRMPLPWLCVSGRSSDPQAAASALRGIIEEEVRKISEKLDPKPYVFDEKYGEAEICSLGGLPEGAVADICPDFSPGFATWRDRMLVFTSKPFAFRVLDSLGGERVGPSERDSSTRSSELALKKANMTIRLDVKNLSDGLSMQGYRDGLAELMLPLDWRRINEKIAAEKGQLQEIEFKREQMKEKARIEADRARLAASVHQNSQVLRILESVRLDCAAVAGASGSVSALRGRVLLLFKSGG